jgi:hypothetical protein
MGRQLSSRPKEGHCSSFCRPRLAACKRPRVYQFRVELPKNSLGQVTKDELTLS